MSLRRQQLVSKQSELTSHLPPDLHRIVSLSSKKGASSLVTVLPIEENMALLSI